MRDLRVTHGGFYQHFDSKEDLFAEASGLGLQQVSRQRRAVMLFSGMAGTLNVARALTDERRRRVLEDARTFYLKAVGD